MLSASFPALKQDDLNGMMLVDLRKMAREMYTGDDKTRIAFMKKEEIIPFIESMLNGDTAKPEIVEKPKKDDDLADVIAKAIGSRIKPELDEKRVLDLIQQNTPTVNYSKVMDMVKSLLPKKQEIVVTTDTGSKVEVGLAHKTFPTLLKLASLRANVFLTGPAGSGKTFACEQVAKALNIPFYFDSVGMQTSKTDLLGFTNANGIYVPTKLRLAYENGGVYLMDEIDAGNPNVLTIINAMLANGIASFPDGMVKRHPDFIFFAAGNTWGLGGDIQYVGRNKIDAATLNRFVTVYFDYDEDLETDLCDNKEWVKKIQNLRAAVARLKEKVLVTPRATIMGAKMLTLGFTENECLDALVFQGVNPEVRSRIVMEGGRI